MNTPVVQVQTVDLLLRVRDICLLLKISRRRFYELKAAGWFGGEGPELVEVAPRIGRQPRYRGEPFAEWLSPKGQARSCRAELRMLSAV